MKLYAFLFLLAFSVLDQCWMFVNDGYLCPGGLGHEEWRPDIVWHWEMAVGRQSLGAKAFLRWMDFKYYTGVRTRNLVHNQKLGIGDGEIAKHRTWAWTKIHSGLYCLLVPGFSEADWAGRKIGLDSACNPISLGGLAPSVPVSDGGNSVIPSFIHSVVEFILLINIDWTSTMNQSLS